MDPTREVRIPDTIRIFVPESRKKEVTKDYFVRNVVLGALAVKVEDVLALHDHLARGYVDITFLSSEKFYAKLHYLKQVKADWQWGSFVEGLKFTYYQDLHPLIVYMYDSHVEETDIKTFLARYCARMGAGVKLRDEFGFWTGKRRFMVSFRKNQSGDDVLPPGSFFLGPFKGLLYVPGRVHACWSCGETGHVKSECEGRRCRHCGSLEHVSRDCRVPKSCSLCGQEGHLFRACPRRTASFAEKARGGVRAEEKAKAQEGRSGTAERTEGKGGEKKEGKAQTKDHVPPLAIMADGTSGKHKGPAETPVQDPVDEWEGASASQEAEMVELAAGGKKRPSQDSTGADAPVRRLKPGVGTFNRFAVLQEDPASSEEVVRPVETGDAAGGPAVPPGVPGRGMPGVSEPPPESPELASEVPPLLPGFEEVLGVTESASSDLLS